MLILNSNAYHIFWLGRYFTRMQHLCEALPFHDDAQAIIFSHAFCLAAYDASSLNEILYNPQQPASLEAQARLIWDNVQELRGVLSAKSYAELRALTQATQQNTHYICQTVDDCADIFEAEHQDIFLFFSLGKAIEGLDFRLRLKQDLTPTLTMIEDLMQALNEMGWQDIISTWQELKTCPDMPHFHRFYDQLSVRFEEG